MQVVIIHNVKYRLLNTEDWKINSIPVGTKEFGSGNEATEFCKTNSKELTCSDEYGDYIIGNLSWQPCAEFDIDKFNEKLSYGVVF